MRHEQAARKNTHGVTLSIAVKPVIMAVKTVIVIISLMINTEGRRALAVMQPMPGDFMI